MEKLIMTTSALNTETTGYEKGSAEVYKTVQDNIHFQQVVAPVIKNLIKENVKPGDSVLDLGCGYGTYVESFLEQAKKYRGVDISDSQINIAKKVYSENSATEFFVGDAKEYRTEDKFDVVTAFYVVNYARSKKDLVNFFTTIYKALEDDGVFFGINASAFLPVEAYEGFKPYNLDMSCEIPRLEGSRIFINVSEELVITNYWWTEESYREAAREANLRLVLAKPNLTFLDQTNSFWKHMLDFPQFMVMKATKMH